MQHFPRIAEALNDDEFREWWEGVIASPQGDRILRAIHGDIMGRRLSDDDFIENGGMRALLQKQREQAQLDLFEVLFVHTDSPERKTAAELFTEADYSSPHSMRFPDMEPEPEDEDAPAF